MIAIEHLRCEVVQGVHHEARSSTAQIPAASLVSFHTAAVGRTIAPRRFSRPKRGRGMVPGMQRWGRLRAIAVATLALSVGVACKDKDADKAKDTTSTPAMAPTAADLDAHCDLLGKTCGDTDKHIEKIVEECRQVAKKQVEKGCTDKAIALSNCYAKELCGKADKVWTFGDLPVLAERKTKCIAERATLDACAAK